MNLDHLSTYRQVVELGSFSEAAKKLSITQPAVSFQIQKLERDLGVRLLDRSHKTIKPTEAGKRLLLFAHTVGREWQDLAHDLDQLREEMTGDIVIAASTIPGEILIPPILGDFRALHPAIGVRVDISDSVTVISRVREGAYDVGFCGSAPEGKDLDYFRFAQDEIVLIASPGHPFSRREAVSMTDLMGENLILREGTSGTQRTLQSIMAKAGLDTEKWSPTMVLGTSQAVVSAVEARLGIAFVSNLAIEKSAALGLVAQIPVHGLTLVREFYCVYRKERVVSRLLGEFIDFVRVRAAESGPGQGG
jgi:DNA-binding transcriptional LysR family regulator